MARGNQRELARQKNMKKTQEISKGKRKEDSLTASQRKQRVSLLLPRRSTMAQSQLTATSTSRVQVILLPQPPK
uniref:Small EDRK-rich factor-like N-terminal domain-containing protein n=1 Tax=Pan troglodytes TaxID=9598 RepID=A0A2I3TT04_PANTR